jgi:polysaccharide biosynthesis/export protein
MPKTMKPLAAIVFFMTVVSFTGCKTTNNLSYFQNLPRDTVLQNTVSKNFDLKIKTDDLLSIGISSASPELSGLFNTSQSGGAGTAGGYLVDKNGAIQLYKLGDVKLAGLTRDEAKEKLQKELAPYLKDPVVSVRFANHQVIVLGAVSNPGALSMTTDQITVLEAIGKSGDLTEKAKRDNVLVIRQTGAGKEFRHLNLLDHSVFASPYYYLQNEDVVYVEQDVKRGAERNAQIISYVVSGISIVTFLLSRLIK